MKMLKACFQTFAAIFILIFFAACRMPDNFGFYQPVLMETRVPDGPAEYKAGWHNGCQSAMGVKLFANGGVYQKGAGPVFGQGAFHHDSMYQTGWGQGWFSCVLTINEFVDKHPMKFFPLD